MSYLVVSSISNMSLSVKMGLNQKRKTIKICILLFLSIDAFKFVYISFQKWIKFEFRFLNENSFGLIIFFNHKETFF